MRVVCILLLFACLSMPANAQVRIVVLGDATTSGYMLNANDGFAKQLETTLNTKRVPAKVFDISSPSATMADAYNALPSVLALNPDIVIVAAGTNDVARGLGINEAINTPLHYILHTLKEKGIGAFVLGVVAPDSRGKDYQAMLISMYDKQVFRNKATVLRDAYKPWREDSTLTLADGVHPNAKGTKLLVERVLPYLADLIHWAQTKNYYKSLK